MTNEAGGVGEGLAVSPARRLGMGLLSGALIGFLAGLFFAAETIVRNPGIQGFHQKAIVFLFFPVLYLLPASVVGVISSIGLYLVPRRIRARLSFRDAPFTAGTVAAFFAFLEGIGRCYECHQWYRDTFPSLTITVAHSFTCFLALIGVCILFGVLFGLAVFVVARWAGYDARRRRGLWIVFVALSVFAVLFSVTRPGPSFCPPVYERGIAALPQFRIRLILMDGVDWDFANPVLEAGRMPNLQALIDRGTRSELGVSRPTISPYMWTNISTGVDDNAHGLCDFFGYRPPGTNALITRYPGIGNSKRFVFQKIVPLLSRRGIGKAIYASGDQKRVPEIWNYLSDAGRRVCVVGWRYSSPAESVHGIMVSDRFGKSDFDWPTIYPDDLKHRVRRDFSEEARRKVREIIGDHFSDTAPEDLGIFRSRVESLQYQMERDMKFTSLAKTFIDSLSPDFAAIGLTAVDAVEHQYIVEYVLRKDLARSPLTNYLKRFTTEEAIQDLAGTIDNVYAVWDSLLGVLTRDAGNDLVIIISDHGHDLDGSGHRFGPKGIIVMAGGPVLPGALLHDPSLFDIMPTVLHASGLPVPSGVAGRVLTEAFDPAWIAANTVRTIRPGPKGPEVLAPEGELPKLTDKELEDLKALGYVD